MTYFDGQWLAFGNMTGSASEIFASDDGLTWTRAKSPIFEPQSQAAAGTNSIVIAAFSGTAGASSGDTLSVVQSLSESVATNHLTDVHFLDSRMQLSVGGDAGASVLLEGTSALGPTSLWNSIATIPVSPTPRPIVVSPTANSSAYFLRATPATP